MAKDKTLRVEFGDWDTVIADAYAIREDVFVEEQCIPAELEFDDMDAQCLHTVVYLPNGEAGGTGRLLPDGHIGRIAVRGDARGRGVGSLVLQGLMDKARERGDKAVMLNAQTRAEAFYERFGFKREGAEFDEAGIPHIAMRHTFG
jgi:predicted GNAT family N-acyltransferase